MKKYSVILETPRGPVQLKVGSEEYILEAALKRGLELPHTCLQGWCVTCAGRLLEGEVDQSEAFRLFPEDEAGHFVLLCSAKPRSHLRIQTHQQESLKQLRKAHGLPAPLG